MEFNNYVKPGRRQRSKTSISPGATALQLNWYVPAITRDDLPDTVIICAGTNNITKIKETSEDAAKEIINIAERCRKGGVITVSIFSLICRPPYHKHIDKINKMLNYYAGVYNYTFTDNNYYASMYNYTYWQQLLRKYVQLHFHWQQLLRWYVQLHFHWQLLR